MTANLWVGVGAVVLLGGGMVAFTQFRAAAERDAEVAGLVAEVASQVGPVFEPAADFDPDLGRGVLRQLRRVRESNDVADLALAESQLLLALGQAREAWDVVRPLATEPGAEAMPQAVGAVVAARLGAESGDEGLIGQAQSFARRYADETGEAQARVLEWQLAFRAGDPEGMAAAGESLVASAGVGADLVAALSGPLGELLGQRLGVDVSAGGGSPVQAALARVVAQGTGRPTIRDLDELAARFVVVPPELELVAARRSLEAFGDLPQEGRRGGEAENLLRDALRRIELALASVPSSADARAVAVLAHLFMSESFGLDPDAASRFRGHLSWLLASGPKTHVQRPVWEQLARDAGR